GNDRFQMARLNGDLSLATYEKKTHIMAYKHEKGRNAMRQVKRRQQGRLTNASSNHQSTFSKKVKKKGCGCGKKKRTY
ncbi:hypothetical protein, partial [Bacillus licheniformis]